MADARPDRASHLVVVGSSAGGIEALCTLLGSLPAGFPAAVVLAQHVDPARPSFLASILERKTPLPVVLVEKETPLENGKVYLVPSNQHVVIEDGQVNVDHVADLEGLGCLLHHLVTQTTAPASDEAERQQVLPELLNLVSGHAAIDFQSYKQPTILRRIGRRMTVTHMANLREYLAHAKTHPEELSELARSFLIKVTEFFRDPEAFDYLRRDMSTEVSPTGIFEQISGWTACAQAQHAPLQRFAPVP